ncbi:hypothetical protein [Hymenobacter siberiensis]|uniref:hypothetical protein n=1 Tax=Hymenobacter siberiensis TaxID=2848396 RepID=UPI001C1DFF57|nr:hypothetical protein [Hymenobacter siberiensis]MBU6122927.1 hypothetical protein [Hymenobacter siberiensis]
MTPPPVSWNCCLAVAALLLAGCGKDPSGPTTVSGQVVGEGGGQAVPRPPQVQLWQRAQATGGGNLLSGGGTYAPQGSPQAVDGQGRFSFGFQAEAGHEYVLRAEDGGLGYYTDWTLAPGLRGGAKNEGVAVPAAAPGWVRLDLVDELPKSRAWFSLWGWGGGGMYLAVPRDTTVVVRYLANRQEMVLWEITNEKGVKSRYDKSFTLAPLDTLRVRIAF